MFRRKGEVSVNHNFFLWCAIIIIKSACKICWLGEDKNTRDRCLISNCRVLMALPHPRMNGLSEGIMLITLRQLHWQQISTRSSDVWSFYWYTSMFLLLLNILLGNNSFHLYGGTMEAPLTIWELTPLFLFSVHSWCWGCWFQCLAAGCIITAERSLMILYRLRVVFVGLSEAERREKSSQSQEAMMLQPVAPRSSIHS